MATEVLRRRGTTAEHATFTGGAGELTIDTTKKTAIVHDGSTAGGIELINKPYLAAIDTHMIPDMTGGANNVSLHSLGSPTAMWKDIYVESINSLRVGRGAGNIDTNTAVGSGAFNANTTGVENTAVGRDALFNNTTGNYNTAVGTYALDANTTSERNTAVGAYALGSNTVGGSNTAVGLSALFNNTEGGNNTAIGVDALSSNTLANKNTAIGRNALKDTTTGENNTAVGNQTLENNTNGEQNTAIGSTALSDNTTGDNNVAIGQAALRFTTTGSGNFGAAFRNSSGGYVPVFNPTTHSNRVVMGHTGVTNAYVQVAWTVVSDARDKTQIAPLTLGLDFVNQLTPVSYKFRTERGSEETNGKKRYGFLAQEVLEAEGADNVIVDTEDPEKLKMTNEELIPVLVKAIQELKAEIETLKGAN